MANLEYSLLTNTLMLTLQLAVPILLACLVGAIISSLVKALTQIDEVSVALTFKLICVGLVLFFGSSWIWSTIEQFGRQTWSTAFVF